MSGLISPPQTDALMPGTEPRPRRSRQIVTALLAVGILAPSLWGFGSKFVEFLALYRSNEEGSFAIMPVLNYLMASSGFLLLFCWAVFQGTFRDIEKPKYTMLDNERCLDEIQDHTDPQTN